VSQNQVERYREPLPSEIPLEVRGDWLRIGRLAKVAQASKICPRAWRKDPEGIFTVFWLKYSRGDARRSRYENAENVRYVQIYTE
jgi:hypothetical protein